MKAMVTKNSSINGDAAVREEVFDMLKKAESQKYTSFSQLLVPTDSSRGMPFFKADMSILIGYNALKRSYTVF